MSSPVVNVYLVRHGETDENRAMIMQGHLDTKLNAAGLEQAQLAANALENVKFTAAYSSDLSRAAKTAEIIIAKHPGVKLQTHKALRERYMGSIEGTKIDKSRRISLPPNAESAKVFSDRADNWWKEIILPYTTSGLHKEDEEQQRNILVVSHGGLMHVLIQDLLESGQVVPEQSSNLGLLTRHGIPNASISVIQLPVQSKEVDKEAPGTVVLFADTTHLDVEFVNGNADVVDE